ncbi:MAG: hypothetical protein ACRCTQ_06790 [Brevinemataceae bacterium]
MKDLKKDLGEQAESIFFWNNFVALILSIIGPVLFVFNIPPLILSIIGLSNSLKALYFKKHKNYQQFYLSQEYASNCSLFALWWIFWIYIFSFVILIFIQTTIPSNTGNKIYKLVTPVYLLISPKNNK